MMTTSARGSPDSDGRSGAGSAVLAHSELAGSIGVQAFAMAARAPASSTDGRVGEGLHGREMEIGFRQLRHFGLAAKACVALAPLDPADLVAEPARNPDVVMLALSHVQNIGLLVAEGRLPALVVGEEFGVRLCYPGVVGADGVVAGGAEGLRTRRQSRTG